MTFRQSCFVALLVKCLRSFSFFSHSRRLTDRFFRFGPGCRPTVGLILCWMIGIVSIASYKPVAAAEAIGAKSLHIVTPQWEGQTNEDGTGLFFEIIQKVYEPDGIAITYEFAPWKRARKMVSANAADAMLCVWKEDAREARQLTPRFPLFVEFTAAVFRKEGIEKWNGIESLNGKRAVWLRGYDYYDNQRLSQVQFADWLEVDDYAHAWLLLEKKRYDVYIDALIDLEHYIASQKVDMDPYQLEMLWQQNAYVAFSPVEKSKALMAIYDRRIQELFKSGALETIYHKWEARFSPEAWQLQVH